jgi:hypothetical protein
MGLSKDLRRAQNKLSRGVDVANKVAGKTSNVLNKTSNVLDKVSNVSGKILSNPIVEGIVASNPELMPLYAGAVGASQLVGTAGKVAGKGASVAGKASNVLEKASSMSSSTPAIQFA